MALELINSRMLISHWKTKKQKTKKKPQQKTKQKTKKQKTKQKQKTSKPENEFHMNKNVYSLVLFSRKDS